MHCFSVVKKITFCVSSFNVKPFNFANLLCINEQHMAHAQVVGQQMLNMLNYSLVECLRVYHTVSVFILKEIDFHCVGG